MISYGAMILVAVLLGAAAFTWWQSGVIARSYPATGKFVDLGDGARLHYTERWPAGPPLATVILLHGASGNQADLMIPLGDKLAAAGFRVVAPDRPGHGWSDRSNGSADASPTRQAQILLQAFRRIGVSRAIVVGHSWSGALAATFALDHPDFTQGLVLLAPVLYAWPGGIAWYYDPALRPWVGAAFTRLAAMPAGLLLMNAGIAEVFAPQPAPAEFARRTGVYLLLRPSEFTANAQDVEGLHGFVTDQGPRMKLIGAPTAIVTGDADGIVSPRIHAERAAREIRGATLTVLPGVGHSPHWSEPDRVVAAIVGVAARALTQASVSAE